MTESELLGSVNEYLANHLDKSFWDGLDESAKSASVAMATFDILADLPGVSISGIKPDSFTSKAIAEQAVFLARNYENINEGKVVTSENVGGVSQGYTLIGDHPGLSFRAVAFIKRAKAAITGCSMRISRG